MQVTVHEFVEHGFHCVVVVSQRIAYAVRQARIIDQLAQALPRELEMS